MEELLALLPDEGENRVSAVRRLPPDAGLAATGATMRAHSSLLAEWGSRADSMSHAWCLQNGS